MPALPPVISDASITSKPYSWFPTTGIYYGYCTIADVQAEFLDQSNMGSSVGNKLFMAQIITDTAQELQNQLELAYQMPYTGTNTGILATLNEINRLLAAANLYERTFGANAPDASTLGEDLRAKAEARILGILDGEEQWSTPYGDAIAQPQHAAYPRAALALSSPTVGDPNAPSPIFSIGRTRINRDGLM